MTQLPRETEKNGDTNYKGQIDALRTRVIPERFCGGYGIV